MTSIPSKILAFSGSARTGSFNQLLVNVAATGASESGADVTVINLGDFDLPIFNEDLEKEGRPPAVDKLKDLFKSHDGLLIASPEYNGSVSPLLKNAIDWVTRPDEGESPLSAFQGKVAGIMAASPGGLGGLRGLVHIRSILGNIGVIVIPKQIAIGSAFDAFDESGCLKKERDQATVMEIGQRVADIAQRLKTD